MGYQSKNAFGEISITSVKEELNLKLGSFVKIGSNMKKINYSNCRVAESEVDTSLNGLYSHTGEDKVSAFDNLISTEYSGLPSGNDANIRVQIGKITDYGYDGSDYFMQIGTNEIVNIKVMRHIIFVKKTTEEGTAIYNNATVSYIPFINNSMFDKIAGHVYAVVYTNAATGEVYNVALLVDYDSVPGVTIFDDPYEWYKLN